MSNAIARRYAQALIEIAADVDAVEVIGSDLQTVVALCARDEAALGQALESPVFTTEERRQVLDALFPKLGLHAVTKNVLHLMNDKGRIPLLADLADAYSAMADDRAGRARVTVETAEPITPQLESEIRAGLAAMTGKDVVLTTRVDPALIGGLVARVGDTVYDSSLRTRLENMRHNLISSPIGEA